MGCLWLIVGTFLVVFMLACFFLGCDHLWRTDVVKARIHYTATDPGDKLTEVYLYAGAGNISWVDIAAGEIVSATLVYDSEMIRVPGHRVVVALVYKLDGKRYDWDGLLFPHGMGYRIELTIDAEGAVTYRCCILPCRLATGNSPPDKGCAKRFRGPGSSL